MNILIVSENFLKGGLETNVYSQYEKLRDNNKLFFAFGKYDKTYKFENCKIYEDFNFNFNCTIKQFVDDAEKLITIIKENNIDLIHVHPSYSIFPVIMASQMTSKPVVYTYHGSGSFTFPNNVTAYILLNLFLDKMVNKIFLVSKIGEKIFKNHLHLDNCVYLPNAIDVDKFKQNQIISNKMWALISRLDGDKYKEIEKLILNFKKLNIESIDIYGDGSCRIKLEELVEKEHLSSKIKFKGYSCNIHSELDGNYNGVIGIGRVIMEGIAMGYPTIIIGVNRIGGVVDKKIYDEIKYINFANFTLPDLSVERVNLQLNDVYKNANKYNFRKELKNNFSSEIIWKNYEQEILNLNCKERKEVKNFYLELFKMVKDDSQKYENILFYESKIIHELFIKHLEFYCLTRDLKFVFLQMKKNDYLEYRINCLESILLDYKSTQDKNLAETIDKINIKFLFKNTFSKFKNKLRGRK